MISCFHTKKGIRNIHKLHKSGIAHRDIKLENIMITRSGEVKVIDLGYSLSMVGRDEDGFLTTRVGSKMYMAPEIIGR